MKPSKLLFIITFMVFTGNIFAQNNDMKARIEFEDAETAYQNGDYEKTITHLTEAEKLLGFWTAKTGYLKIIVLNKMVNYRDWNDNTAELYRQVKEYMKYTEKNSDKIDTDKFREVYFIEQRINYTRQIKEWNEMPEYKNGQKAQGKRDYRGALEWYKKAVDKGNIEAMFFIAYLYREGKGVSQNYGEAMSWYEKAAKQGNVYSMYIIGEMYFKAQGVSQNYQEAMKWYKKAYESGYTDVKNDIAKMYEQGLGVQKDVNKAKEWRNK